MRLTRDEVAVTCRAAPIQIEGNLRDGRSYYFRARETDKHEHKWYLSIVPYPITSETTTEEDMARVIPARPAYSGTYDPAKINIMACIRMIEELVFNGLHTVNGEFSYDDIPLGGYKKVVRKLG